MPRRFLLPFAQNGDRSNIPDGDISSTSVNFYSGYGQRYALQYGVNPQALPVERELFNQLMFDITGNIKDWQDYGLPEWTNPPTAAQNYLAGAVVRYRSSVGQPYLLFRCLSTAGTAVAPTDDGVNWERIRSFKEMLSLIALTEQYADLNSVPDEGDFNSLPDPQNHPNGVYKFNSDAKVQGWDNAPPTKANARAGVLEQYFFTPSGGTAANSIVTQRYSDRSGAVYVRSRDSGSQTWSPWINVTIRGGATGGGDDRIFYLNDLVVRSNYNIPANQNAGSFGPITFANGVTVVIPDGSTYTVV